MTAISTALRLRSMNGPDTDQRVWLEDLLRRLNVTATELARRAELNPSTLTRFLNADRSEGHTLTFRTIRKIEDAVRLAQPKRPSTYSDEGRPFDFLAAPAAISGAVNAIMNGRNACDPWEITTKELQGICIALGDVVLVDLNETPAPGDVVCAQIYDGPVTRTVFRLYEPPFLLTGSAMGNSRRPIIVDNTNAVVRGVVIAVIKPRGSHIQAA